MVGFAETTESDGLSIFFEGYGVCGLTEGAPVHIELYNRQVRVMIFEDINSESPSIIANLDNARELKRWEGDGKIFQFELEGYSGSTDKTDYLVKWVKAPSASVVYKFVVKNRLRLAPISEIQQIFQGKSGIDLSEGVDLVLDDDCKIVRGTIGLTKITLGGNNIVSKKEDQISYDKKKATREAQGTPVHLRVQGAQGQIGKTGRPGVDFKSETETRRFSSQRPNDDTPSLEDSPRQGPPWTRQ